MRSSTDIWFIAFLMSKDIKIEKYEVISKGKVRCYFNINDELWMNLKLQFNNSEAIKFKGLIEQIKDLGF